MGLLSTQISTKKMVPLCRQFATSYEAGIPVVRSLSLIGEQTRDSRARRVMQDMAVDIENGASLGDAARNQHKYLPEFFIQLLSAGETGGRLDAMLRDLAQYYEDRLAMGRKISAMLAYPIVQLTAAWFLGTFALRLASGINPSSTERFELGNYFRDYAIFQGKAMAIFAAIVVVCIILARFGVFQWIWGWFTNFVWPLKPVTRKFALARFFRSMSLLIGSGMNIKHCIQSSAAMTVNPYIQRDLLQSVPHVSDGATLAQAFAGCKTLTPVAHEMIFVGEQSGNLEETLHKVSEYHLEEATHAVYKAISVLGILILLTMACLVGWIIISFYMNLYGNMLEGLGI